MNNYKNLFNLDGLKVFIIGGNGLIGSEIVSALITHNAHVTVFDIVFDKKFYDNYNLKFVKFDCSNEKNIKNFFKLYLKKNSCPDIFINASYPITKDWKKNTFNDISYKSYKKNIEIHMNSYIWSAKIIADQMKKNKIKGSIIQLSSIYGLIAQDNNLYQNTNIKENMTYGIIKSSVIHFTKQMAAHYGKSDIRINNIIIGGVRGHIKGSKEKQDLNFLNKIKKKIPLGRMAKANEIPSSVIFLASSSSSYITGSNIIVDGGYTIL
jgi:NAD(P)-dependent dehydrogenase (short-subunit alcohol dehydrogenase family)